MQTTGLNQGAIAGKTGSKGVPVLDATAIVFRFSFRDGNLLWLGWIEQ